METDERLDLVQEIQGKLWEARLAKLHRNRKLYEWISTFHPDKRPCYLANLDLYYGSYNVGCKVIFDDEDGTVWLIRFPQARKIHSSYADEKVAMEVAAINLIRRDTTIPVPEIKAWGIAAQNPLALGPFIMMEFIKDAVGLNKLLREPGSDTRLLREDVTDDEIGTIYRQLARILLQLWRLNFEQIGNLEPETNSSRFPARPLTWKGHDILQTGGVETFHHRDTGFPSTTEYFQSIIEQDWDQLVFQANSVYAKYDALAKYRSLKVLKALLPNFIHKEYDETKFKFVCDDLGLANLMVKSRDDLTIVGVVDLEWSYAGPAQLAASAPWWLLMDRPTDEPWDCYSKEPVAITSRYFKYLEIFKRVMKEEEANMPGHEHCELSKLVQWSEDSGAMWFHMILSSGFNDPSSFPFTRLIQYVGRDEWKTLEDKLDQDEAEAFADKKMLQLEQYKLELKSMKEQRDLVGDGTVNMAEFATKYAQSLVCAGPVSQTLIGSLTHQDDQLGHCKEAMLMEQR